MARRDIVVIGASAGGADALTQLVASLPRAFAVPMFIVQHQAPYSTGFLPTLSGGIPRCGSITQRTASASSRAASTSRRPTGTC